MARVVCFGELLLRLGAPGRERLLQTPRLDVCVGGAEANVAVGLVRLGHDVSYVSVVDDNALGEAALGELRRYGVSTDAVLKAPGRMGLYFLETGAIQRPSQVLYDRAGSAFAKADAGLIDWSAALAGASRLHMSGITPATGPQGAEAATRAMAAARAAGVPVSFDGNYRPSLWAQWGGDARAILHDLASGADVLFGDHRDLSLMLGREVVAGDSEAAAFEAFPDLRVMASTSRTATSADHNRLSARLATRDGTVTAGPVEVGPIVDRIGGGDAFAVGVLDGLLRGIQTSETVRRGLAAACLKHAVPGDLCLVEASEIDALVAEQGVDVRR